jgi:hypothetical protein
VLADFIDVLEVNDAVEVKRALLDAKGTLEAAWTLCAFI